MVNETGADNAEVLRRRANGLPVDADLMQRVRAQNEKNKASKQDPDGNEVLQGGARKDAKSSTAVSPKDRWNRIRRMRSINRGMTLASQLRGDAAVPALAVPLTVGLLTAPTVPGNQNGWPSTWASTFIPTSN